MGPSSRIFISYRRDDSSGHASRLSDWLSERLGRDKVFMDVEDLEPGEDFVEAIERTVGSVDALIAVIGRSWLTATDAGGRRRLDDPSDWVRVEVATALRRGIRVIPVLVQGAPMPTEDDLPTPLAPLARRNALEISDLHWDAGVARLVSTLERLLGKSGTAPRRGAATGGVPPTRRLRRGHKGEDVRELQRRLVQSGFDPGRVDGIFGFDTEQAVRRFQASHALDVDGIAGPRTRDALASG